MKTQWYSLGMVLGVVLLSVELPLVYIGAMPLSFTLQFLNVAISFVFLVDSIYRLKSRIEKTENQNWFKWIFFLLIDIVSVIPFTLISSPVSVLIVAPILRKVRAVQWYNNMLHRSLSGVNFYKLGLLSYTVFISLHWIACIWILLRRTQFDDSNFYETYINSFYWATATLATVGYGDITPVTSQEKLFAVFVMLCGFVMYGYVIGNIASILNNIDPALNHHRENSERLHTFMRYRSVPIEIQRRVNMYLNHLWEKRMGYDENTIISQLPPGMQLELSLYLKRDVLNHVDVFRNASNELLRTIAVQLQPIIVSPGEFVFHSGDTARRMYFISKGNVEVVNRQNEVIATLSKGDFFGEMALLHGRKRTASVRSIDYTDLYVLDKSGFERILEEFPEFRANIESVAKRRLPS